MINTILIGGKAGQGPNLLANLISEILVEKGLYIFNSRDYESVIRGGHNFNIITFSENPISSNESRIDILICLDEETEFKHKKNLKKGGIILNRSNNNIFYAGKLLKMFNLPLELLDEKLKKLEKKYSENIESAKRGYNEGDKKYCDLKGISEKKAELKNGSKSIVTGALNSKMDLYYAYPMTPATQILFELGLMQKENTEFKSIELENEISVVLAGIGSCICGKKTMVGTSGGGFDLMTEGLSLCGQSNIPLVFYLSMRPGPATGVATYTSQGDLKLALNSGHGEFNRIVLIPGDPKECEELTNQAFFISHKFETPSIILSDKHLSESIYSVTEKSSFLKIESKTNLKRYNSYEKDKEGSATEDPEIIKKNIEERLKIKENIKKELKKLQQFKIYGDKKAENIIISCGSTKGAILDAIKETRNICFVQILYLEPFPDIRELIKEKNIIVIENNSTSQLADIIQCNNPIKIENKILRYDGRPFFHDELKLEIKKRLR